MDCLNYIYGVVLPQSLSDKLCASQLLPEVTQEMQEPWYVADAFTANGVPVQYDRDTLYPVYAPRYLQQNIPSTLLEVTPGYSSTASVAAVKWLDKILTGSDVLLKHFDGETFSMSVDGKRYQFCFPTMKIAYSKASAPLGLLRSRLHAIILPFPDSRENDEDWEGATIPSYAESQARFTQWCWRQSVDVLHRHKDGPVDCYVVRITGNTPSDVTVRTVHADPAKEDILVARICKAFSAAKAKGIDLVATPKVRPQLPWFERRQSKIEAANHIEDPDFYMLVRRYMELTTLRKTKEEESAKIKQEMDAIAISLAAETTPAMIDTGKGTVTDTAENVVYTVAHKRKSARAATISAALVKQFFPEHMDCIVTNEIPRGRITIAADD